ncbi:MAG: DMT family transporter, partial [bacterium]|nr:DMT family transporter [bacterium]
MIYLLLGLAVCAASSAAVLIRLCDAPALVVAAYRLGIAACVVLPLSLMRCGNPLRNVSGRDRLALVSSGVFLGFHFAFWISSLSHTSVASSVLLVTTSPIFLGLGGWLLFRERVNWRTGVGIVVSLVGTAVVTVNDWGIGRHAFSGDVLALGAALAISGHLMIGQ